MLFFFWINGFRVFWNLIHSYLNMFNNDTDFICLGSLFLIFILPLLFMFSF